MKGLANISNPLKWPGMLSGRTKSSGAASNSNAVGLDDFANDPDNARRELEAFLHKLCTRREFGAKHMHVSSASLIDMSRQVQDEEVQDVAAGFGPRSLPVAMDEATCIDIVTTFCLRRLLTRAVAEELLTRAATELAKLPNVVEYTVPEGCFITIVGDLHGQFQDLMHIFRSYGFPSPTRPYLFNGDFVDRGDCGVEITLTLLAFQQYLPGSVLLNRGNHEERSVHMLMGFHQECCSKYDKEIYEMFNVAFAQVRLVLPRLPFALPAPPAPPFSSARPRTLSPPFFSRVSLGWTSHAPLARSPVADPLRSFRSLPSSTELSVLSTGVSIVRCRWIRFERSLVPNTRPTQAPWAEASRA